MNVKIVEAATLKLVGMLMTSAIISTKPEQNVCLRNAVRQDNREIERCESALTKDQAERRTISPFNIKLCLLMATCWFRRDAILVPLR